MLDIATDHLGGTPVTIRDDVSEPNRTRYYPFGQGWTQTGSLTGSDHQRHGRYSGIYYAGARFYSADLGRFMSADPIVSGAGDPSASGGLNRYAFVRNNPLRHRDPSGMIPLDMTALKQQKCTNNLPGHSRGDQKLRNNFPPPSPLAGDAFSVDRVLAGLLRFAGLRAILR
jgi:insecticidal toxin complex protein TccC